MVEDQEAVRHFGIHVLESCGYLVLAASNASAALEIVENHRGPIHLLLTDVVLPGMSGMELAEHIAVVSPRTRVLFTSGYASESSTLRAVLDRGMGFLPKPYTPHVLTAKVREAIDAPGVQSST